MNVVNQEIQAIQTQLAILRKQFESDPNNKDLKSQIKQLEGELNSRLEKIL